jgi:bifunctional non-homologous end joining protein LigD
MPLDTYRRRRDFKHTPEPRGSLRRRTKQLIFVIQKHAARRLHYDFRLELDGVLKSWAVPKQPNPSEKRLAVHVEDHPLDYATFEGTIPEGEYGAGKVELWDVGTWTPKGDPRKDYAQGKLAFTLEGRRLSGGWALIRMRGRAHPGRRDNWLLIKERNNMTTTPATRGGRRPARR